MARLMRELDESIVLTESALRAAVEDGASHLYVARDGERIVGCASLCVYRQPFRTDATVESVVVAGGCRGRQVGLRLMEHVVAQASRLGVKQLHLTSRPTRQAANALYQSLGFALKNTNCYTYSL